ncbi:transmembrane protein, putative (macronuclear) [Tetrahymena thermophila SB210]|uniref:Transmembrane protein, putative n=1 Tax=Tetrahymena thermophila (strain SB210) TaxID=312017 RepID=W7XLC4_TETTS|nr:transmembrane protein, putative [Tetrahymena thermophila SB210]EWS76044.1 transmembrane protein, putative [Tetrahymena thermophila SB210]|eukprot:XP_012651428.1 transmembrane protein, putative [Tetrahymena thermophila SB210]
MKCQTTLQYTSFFVIPIIKFKFINSCNLFVLFPLLINQLNLHKLPLNNFENKQMIQEIKYFYGLEEFIKSSDKSNQIIDLNLNLFKILFFQYNLSSIFIFSIYLIKKFQLSWVEIFLFIKLHLKLFGSLLHSFFISAFFTVKLGIKVYHAQVLLQQIILISQTQHLFLGKTVYLFVLDCDIFTYKNQLKAIKLIQFVYQLFVKYTFSFFLFYYIFGVFFLLSFLINFTNFFVFNICFYLVYLYINLFLIITYFLFIFSLNIQSYSQITAIGASDLGSALANCTNLSNFTLHLGQKQFLCFGLCYFYLQKLIQKKQSPFNLSIYLFIFFLIFFAEVFFLLSSIFLNFTHLFLYLLIYFLLFHIFLYFFLLNNLQVALLISGNKIGAIGASGLGAGLANCINLSNLNIDLLSNKIGAIGASGLSSALVNCTHLSNLTLNLGGNEIGEIGASSLCFNLANCTNLSNLKLKLGYNQINELSKLKVKSNCLKSKRLVVYDINFY